MSIFFAIYLPLLCIYRIFSGFVAKNSKKECDIFPENPIYILWELVILKVPLVRVYRVFLKFVTVRCDNLGKNPIYILEGKHSERRDK